MELQDPILLEMSFGSGKMSVLPDIRAMLQVNATKIARGKTMNFPIMRGCINWPQKG